MKQRTCSNILLIILLLCFRIATAQIQVMPEPVWKVSFVQNFPKPNSKTIQGGYYELLFENQENIETEEDYIHVIRKIESNEGVQYGSQIEVVFDPSYQKLYFHNILIRRNGQLINKLFVNNFKIESNEQESSKFIYNGTKSALLILDDIRRGDEIEYAYTLKGRNPIIAHKYFATMYIGSGSPISQLFQSLIFSKNRNLNFKVNNSAQKAVISEKNGLNIYQWEQTLPAIYEYEDYTPSWYNDKPHIQISEMKEWDELVNWALPMYRVNGQLSADLKAKANEWKQKSAGNSLKYAQLATQFVQDEIRYMGIEVGVNSHQPNLPEKVFRQRFGDCKDKALLLCNLLKYNEIEAYPALVNTYRNKRVDELLVSPYDFNHVIALAKIEQKDIWIDATLSNQRGPVTKLYTPDYGKALVIKSGEKELRTIPVADNGVQKVVETYILPKVGEEGLLSVHSTYKQGTADDMRGLFANSSLGEIEKSYLDFYYSIYPEKKFTLKDSLIYEDNTEDNIFSTTENYSIPNIWGNKDSTTHKYEILIYGKVMMDKLRFLKATTTARKSPINIYFPFEFDYQINIQFPESWTIKEDSFSIHKPYYNFSFTSTYDDEKHEWTLHYYYKALQDYVPAEDLASYTADLTQIENALSRSITWNPSAEEDYGTNWWLVSLCIILTAIFTYFAIKLYRKNLYPEARSIQAQDIGGWLILVAIGLVVSPFILIYSIFNNDYFSGIAWAGIEFLEVNHTLFKTWILFEVISNIFLLCFSVFVIVLFIKQRDILPRYIILLYAITLVQISIDLVLAYQFSSMFTEGELTKSTTEMVKALLRAAIWIPYFLKSERVKDTFVKQYKE